MGYQGFFEILMITLISSKKLGVCNNMRYTVICPTINPMPLFGKSKLRQCFVKTTKCSIKYYLCQNLSATEKVSENANLKMNPSLLNYFQIFVIATFIASKIKD